MDKESKNSEISSVSNLIAFKTLKKPSINITYVDDNQLEIEIELKCKVTFDDTDLKDNSIKQRLDPYNICHYFNISYSSAVDYLFILALNLTLSFLMICYFFSKNNISSTISLKEHIFDRDLKDKNSMMFAKKFKINDLSSDTNYSIQVVAEYFTSFYLYSQKLEFKTLQSNLFFRFLSLEVAFKKKFFIII